MPFAPGVLPVAEVLEALRGFTYRAAITLYEDEDKTKPRNLTGLTVSFVIAGYLTLTVGSGLTLNAGAGEVEVFLTPEQTKNAPASVMRCALRVEETAEEVVLPLRGTITFSNPLEA